MPFSRIYPPAKYVSQAALNIDYNSPIINAHEGDAREISIQVHIHDTNSPVGSLFVLGSNDRSQFDKIFIDANKVNGTIDGAEASHSGAFAIAITSSVGDSEFNVSFVDGVPFFLRLFWDRTSGGSASGGDIDIGYSLKG